jgi:superfamily II DNA/RNA helicase
VNVEHFIVNVGHPKEKQAVFYKLFQREDVKNAFVFCNRKRDIDEVGRFMKSKGIKAAALHGDMEQEQRTAALSAFKEGRSQILVCSDVAARGLDVQGMSHVFNWDVPNNPEDYVHRTGRTGRAGAKGRAFTFSTSNDFKSVQLIEKLIGKKINVFSLDGETAVAPPSAPAEEIAAKPVHEHKRHERPAPKHEKKHQHPRNAPPPEKRSRHEEHHNILSEDNNGTFGSDVPSFLKK